MELQKKKKKKKNLKQIHWGIISANIWWTVTYGSKLAKKLSEKFAASREKCFLTEDTPQKHGYIISSYEPLAHYYL